MDAAHWHLVLTHLPVVGTVFALLLLAVALVTINEGIPRRTQLLGKDTR
jgi:hypothetical protein